MWKEEGHLLMLQWEILCKKVLCSLHPLSFGATFYLVMWPFCDAALDLWRRSSQEPGEPVLHGDRGALRHGQYGCGGGAEVTNA